MKFNSQICTSREQSERLLALGLKKETADCYLFEYDKEKYKVIAESWLDLIADEKYYSQYKDVCIPAWSLHRLIEMMPENVSDDWLGVSFDEISYYHGEGKDMIGWKYYKAGNIYDCIIECYEWLIKEGYFNKEYLAEQAGSSREG